MVQRGGPREFLKKEGWFQEKRKIYLSFQNFEYAAEIAAWNPMDAWMSSSSKNSTVAEAETKGTRRCGYRERRNRIIQDMWVIKEKLYLKYVKGYK